MNAMRNSLMSVLKDMIQLDLSEVYNVLAPPLREDENTLQRVASSNW